MGRPSGTKNNMRTPEEKEKIVNDYLNSGKGACEYERMTGISRKLIFQWIKKYFKNGIDGLKSKTGKCSKKGITGRPKKAATREEKLERENANLKIEIKRLKKVIMWKELVKERNTFLSTTGV